MSLCFFASNCVEDHFFPQLVINKKFHGTFFLDAFAPLQGSWVAGILGLGAILGGLSASYVGNKYGR
jgi:hypothetical protein